MRILVVDDDAVFREELGSLLGEEGHRVEVAPSVPRAEEALADQEFDVVLTDLKMPRHGGLELLDTVRARWPRTLVVVVTGFASVDTALAAMKRGAFDYVRKPFRLDQLRETLRLAAQERAFGAPEGADRDPLREAANLAAQDGYAVLYLGEATAAPPGVVVESLRRQAPADLVPLVTSFVAAHPRSAVVVANLDPWLAAYRLEDIVTALERVRRSLEGHGPLRVGLDPGGLSPAEATVVGSAVTAQETHETLEALANPLRRRILVRFSEGPGSFGEAMRAAGIDDSPKISFHLRKLVDSGLLLHEGERYRLTARGQASVRLLTEASFLPTGPEGSNSAFAARPPPQPP